MLTQRQHPVAPSGGPSHVGVGGGGCGLGEGVRTTLVQLLPRLKTLVFCGRKLCLQCRAPQPGSAHTGVLFKASREGAVLETGCPHPQAWSQESHRTHCILPSSASPTWVAAEAHRGSDWSKVTQPPMADS